ncbi:MAG: tetratricopeptide repeat protein [Saprospiraceae bacterium]
MKGKQVAKQIQQKKKTKIPSGNVPNMINWKTAGLLVAILLLTFFIYLPVLHNTFLAWDDIYYVRDNALIYSFNLKDIFSTNVMANYHPLTILMLAIEYHLFNLSETGYHTVNLLVHLLNVSLVFYAIKLLSKETRIALVAALLFGIHPIHVESVAWVAELKDLMYTFFFLASCIFYLKYLAAEERKYYVLALVMFLFSLLSKGMGASLPIILLLTDYLKSRKINKAVILEKIPFFILAILFGAIAVAAQKAPDVVQDYTVFTFFQRIAFASYSFITYLAKLLLPVNLSAYYPYPARIGNGIPWIYYGYILIVLALIASIFYSLRFTKKIFFGVGFFAATIFLVLQLLPVGNAIMADRYCYVPSIGIFYLCGVGFQYLWIKNHKWIGITIIAGFAIFFCILTQVRTHIWKTDLTLWQDVIGKFQTIPIAYSNLGLSLMNENKLNDALENYTRAIALKPDFPEALVNHGNILRALNRKEEALNDYNKALEFKPNFAIAFFNRGMLYMNEQKIDEAIRDYTSAIEFKPNYSKAYSNRGVIYTNLKRYAEAIADYTKAIEFNPGYMEAYYNRGMAEYGLGDKEAACNDIRQSASFGFKTAEDAIKNVCN